MPVSAEQKVLETWKRATERVAKGLFTLSQKGQLSASTIPTLVRLLSCNVHAAVEDATKALQTFDADPVCEAGAIPPLVELLDKHFCYSYIVIDAAVLLMKLNRDTAATLKASGKLLDIMSHRNLILKIREAPLKAGLITHLVALLSQDVVCSSLVIEAIVMLGHFAHMGSDVIQVMCTEGVIPLLVNFLQASDEVVLEAISTLSVIASDVSGRDAIIESNGIPGLVHLLGTENLGIIKETLHTLQWIVSLREGSSFYKCIYDTGGFWRLLSCLPIDVNSSTKMVAISLVYGVAESGGYEEMQRLNGFLPLVQLLRRDNAKVVLCAMKAMGKFIDLAGASARLGICKAGAIPLLVAMMEAPNTYGHAAATLICDLLLHPPNREDIRLAGSIPPLVKMIEHDGASGALSLLMISPLGLKDVFDAILLYRPFFLKNNIFPRLLPEAERRVDYAIAGDDETALEKALDDYEYLCDHQDKCPSGQIWTYKCTILARGRKRLEEMKQETALQARRDSVGIGHISLPHEHICPITLHKMKDPVIVSDGHTYERDAIQGVLNGNGLSPLTREELRKDVLISNLTLRKCIEEHAEYELHVASEALSSERKRKASEEDESSAEEEPKRRRVIVVDDE